MRLLPPLPRKYKGVLLGSVAVLALFAFFAVFGSRGVIHLRLLQAQQEHAESVAFDLAQKNHDLREHLRRLESDDAYLEKLAREKLGWIMPGEVVYRVEHARRRPAEEPGAGAPRDPAEEATPPTDTSGR